jgi:16S rRNA (cytidine1402-2'-O)-methyltransferase
MSSLSTPLPFGLYIVATPIGNLADLSPRAIETLRGCCVIACEDTRVTGALTHRFNIHTPLTPYHDHNADAVRPGLIDRAMNEAVALVSDAGTPLISDPGFKLVRDARARGLPVIPVPGACAAITALSVAGLPCDQFFFAGFLPSKSGPRRATLQAIATVPGSLVFYESPLRLRECLIDMQYVLGNRDAFVARELTKLHETHYSGTLASLQTDWKDTDSRGELVIVVGPQSNSMATSPIDLDALLRAALQNQSFKQAVADITAKTGLPRKKIYARALALQNNGHQNNGS